MLDNTDDEQDYVRRSVSSAGSDREITLGTTMILLIFFALAAYGAALFAVGYSMGNKHAGANPPVIASAPSAGASLNTLKPAPGMPGKSTLRPPPPRDESGGSVTPPTGAKSVILTVPSPDAEEPSTASPKSLVPAVVPVPSLGAAAANAPMLVVQVAAVSHKEDADLIASTLQRRGYAVNIHNEADKLLHIQVGPFTNKKDAEAMRARLLADGFNAYIK